MHASLGAWSGTRLRVAAGDYLLKAGDLGPVWLVISGVLCVEEVRNGQMAIVHLAESGDCLGVERLCDQAYRFNAKALSVCELLTCEPLLLDSAEVLSASFLRHQQRLWDWAQLRTGPVHRRLEHLLKLLDIDLDDPAARQKLPPLRELGLIVDAAPATVCRELSRFLPPLPAPPQLRTLVAEALRA